METNTYIYHSTYRGFRIYAYRELVEKFVPLRVTHVTKYKANLSHGDNLIELTAPTFEECRKDINKFYLEDKK